MCRSEKNLEWSLTCFRQLSITKTFIYLTFLCWRQKWNEHMQDWRPGWPGESHSQERIILIRFSQQKCILSCFEIVMYWKHFNVMWGKRGKYPIQVWHWFWLKQIQFEKGTYKGLSTSVDICYYNSWLSWICIYM